MQISCGEKGNFFAHAVKKRPCKTKGNSKCGKKSASKLSLEIKPIVKNNDHTKLVLAQNKKILLGQGDFQVVAQGEFMGE